MRLLENIYSEIGRIEFENSDFWMNTVQAPRRNCVENTDTEVVTLSEYEYLSNQQQTPYITDPRRPNCYSIIYVSTSEFDVEFNGATRDNVRPFNHEL